MYVFGLYTRIVQFKYIYIGLRHTLYVVGTLQIVFATNIDIRLTFVHIRYVVAYRWYLGLRCTFIRYQVCTITYIVRTCRTVCMSQERRKDTYQVRTGSLGISFVCILYLKCSTKVDTFTMLSFSLYAIYVMYAN